MTAAPCLIGISGYARSGKDTFAAALVEGRGYERRSFAQPIRDMLYAQDPVVTMTGNGTYMTLSQVVDEIGWEQAKDDYPEVRRLLQALGTEAGRKILGEQVWVNAAMRDFVLDSFGRVKGRKIVFSDVRFRNEAEAIVDRGGIVVRIEREGVGPLNGHSTETQMDDWSFDYVVRNNWTTLELRQRAFDVIDKEQGRFIPADWHAAAAATFQGPYTFDGLARQQHERFVKGTTMSTVEL